MRAVVRATLANQPTLELPYRRVSQPSESVILDALHDLDMRYQSDGMPAWYPWVAVARYQRGELVYPRRPHRAGVCLGSVRVKRGKFNNLARADLRNLGRYAFWQRYDPQRVPHHPWPGSSRTGAVVVADWEPLVRPTKPPKLCQPSESDHGDYGGRHFS